MSRRARIALGVIGLVLAFVVFAWLVIVPWYVRKRLVEEAASQGVTLVVGNVAVSFGSITVSGSTATARDLPGVTLNVGRIEVLTHGFFVPDKITASNASLDIDGKAGDIVHAFDRFLSAHPKTGEGKPLPALALENARVEWKKALGEGTIVRVGDVGGTMDDWEHARAHLASITIETGIIVIGPWSSTLTRENEKSTAEITLAPKVTVTISQEKETITTTALVPDVMALSDLGFPKPLLTIVDLQDGKISVDATHAEDTMRGSGNVRKLHVEGMKIPGALAPAPLEITDLAYGGTLDKMTITTGRFHVGPLSGPIEGTIARPTSAVVIDARSTTDVMSCNDAMRMQASGTLGPEITGHLDQLGKMLGLANTVQGTVTARIETHFDTREPRKSTVVVQPTASCALVFLPK